MPSVYTGIHLTSNYKHFKNPIKPYAKNITDAQGKLIEGIDVKKFGELTNGAKMDVFQRAQFSSETYEAVRNAGIKASKAQKKLNKLKAIEESNKIPLKEHILNIFRRKENKITSANINNLIKKAEDGKKVANTDLIDIKNAINSKDAKKLQSTLEKIDDGYANSMKFIRAGKNGQSAIKSFGTQVFDNFKKEFSFAKGNRFNAGFNVAMTALQFIPNIFNKVVPAFKNNGFKAGMTELGQTFIQAGADLVAYAAGGAVGRTIGAAIGTIAGPIGTFVGGLVGDMLGSMFVGNKVCTAVEKITNKDDAINTGITQSDDQIAQLDAQNSQPDSDTAQVQQTQTPVQTQKVWNEAEVAQIEKGADQLKAQIRAQHSVGLYA